MSPSRKKLALRVGLGGAAFAVLLAAAYYAWSTLHDRGPGAGFVSGNGRIEATEIDVATKLSGRVESISADEGDFVKAGQSLARMQITVLDAQLDEVRAQQQQTVSTAASIEAQVAQRRSDKVAAEAVVTQRQSELEAARRRLKRSDTLAAQGASSMQELDDDTSRAASAQASVGAAKAQVNAAQAGITATQAQLVAAHASVTAAQATVARVQADINDSQLTAPRDGRVQYRVAEPGEVLPAGGKVLNMVDLADVYMTFFLPETAVGKVAMGSEVRVILDAAPEYVIPASVTFVASTAQFTPKSVETANERQKLMFRVKARINRELLQQHLKLVKTGLPGVAWVRVDQHLPWPVALSIKVPG